MTSMLAQSARPAYDFAAYKSLENDALAERIQQIRRAMGPRLLILGHHYQQDDVIALSDLRGDSYQLALLAASHDECRAIAFCGVHFMAETADILANRPERLTMRGGQRVSVILPDLAAGCSLADMADVHQVEQCWRRLGEVIDTGDVTPITYVNSAADLKAFCGRHGGIVCTSANARAALDWAFARRGRVLFFPDQHLGRNTAKAMGVPLEQMPLWDPNADGLGGNTPETIRQSRVILWQGDCSVHQRFLPEHVDYFRQKYPGIKILVHPECSMEVVDKADVVGSTGRIIRAVEEAPPGTKWAIGTELHLVNRLKQQHPEQEIHVLSTMACACATMSRIDLPHLCWALENLAAGTPVNVIEVDPETSRWALESLNRMLEVK
ncbi:MAG: quinolinate synthase NadA [Thermoguttaceae bacterium]|jgi:quinolinate synthase